jgi:hypothetical protein
MKARVRPRSGLAIRHGVTVLNSPGTIDADYRGELQVILVNFGTEPFVVRAACAIAQMVIAPVQRGQNWSKRRMTSTRPNGPRAVLVLPERLRRQRVIETNLLFPATNHSTVERRSSQRRGPVHDLDSFGAIPLESKVERFAGSLAMDPLAMAVAASRGEGACRTRSGGAGALRVRGLADSR